MATVSLFLIKLNDSIEYCHVINMRIYIKITKICHFIIPHTLDKKVIKYKILNNTVMATLLFAFFMFHDINLQSKATKIKFNTQSQQ